MAITIDKTKFKKPKLNELEDGVKEIFQSIEDYLSKDMDHRRVLISIEDTSKVTDPRFCGNVHEAAFNHTNTSIMHWLICASLSSEAICLGLFDAVGELYETVGEAFPQEFKRLGKLKGKAMRIEIAKLVKKLSEKIEEES